MQIGSTSYSDNDVSGAVQEWYDEILDTAWTSVGVKSKAHASTASCMSANSGGSKGDALGTRDRSDTQLYNFPQKIPQFFQSRLVVRHRRTVVKQGVGESTVY